MLFSEPKIPQSSAGACGGARTAVSVLFSEPKIPQLVRPCPARPRRVGFQCSSASRKFLNVRGWLLGYDDLGFQCSSASRKFLNLAICAVGAAIWYMVSVLFSEPKIPQWHRRMSDSARSPRFQCSSASRKFLNRGRPRRTLVAGRVSVLFSEPKIPQFDERTKVW